MTRKDYERFLYKIGQLNKLVELINDSPEKYQIFIRCKTHQEVVELAEKWGYKMPFVCGATNLGEALRRIGEGASMIRTKGEAGTGDVVQAVTHARQILSDIKKIQRLDDEELMTEAKNLGAPYELVCEVKNTGKLPVVNFAAGGIATPADAALLMQIGVEGVFVGSGIFKSGNPSKMADAIVQATTHYEDADLIAEISKNLGGAMKGDEVSKLDPSERLEKRGW